MTRSKERRNRKKLHKGRYRRKEIKILRLKNRKTSLPISMSYALSSSTTTADSQTKNSSHL